MSLAIVMSLRFITSQLEIIQGAFGGGPLKLSLVDITNIIPPTVIELFVSFYLLAMVFILSLFSSGVKVGNDTYQLFRTIKNNLLGFVIYTGILFMGYILFKKFVFEAILAV
jgi:hypothetical protein